MDYPACSWDAYSNIGILWLGKIEKDAAEFVRTVVEWINSRRKIKLH